MHPVSLQPAETGAFDGFAVCLLVAHAIRAEIMAKQIGVAQDQLERAQINRSNRLKLVRPFNQYCSFVQKCVYDECHVDAINAYRILDALDEMMEKVHTIPVVRE